MKNIHVIPTDEPSRLVYFGVLKELYFSKKPIGFKVFERSPQHIYITSDEEIEKADWSLDIKREVISKCIEIITKSIKQNDYLVFEKNMGNPRDTYKKIILTTDPDLIKDGVQPIDDEFLEWFVKNPTCENVEVNKVSINCSCAYQSEHRKNANIIKENTTCHLRNNCKIGYRIIIPKEEQTYKLIKEYYGSKPLGSILKHSELEVCNWNEYYEIIPKEEPFRHTSRVIPTEEILANRCSVYEFIDFDKQETLEEAAKEFVLSHDFSLLTHPNHLANRCFQLGAKWQAERSYSEEDMREAYKYGRIYDMTSFEEWFEQFKKK